MVMVPLVVALAVAGAVAGATPVTVEIVASGHVETPATAFRVTGNVLACGPTQAEADRLLAQKTAAIEQSVSALGARKAHAAQTPSLAGMMAGLTATRSASACNSDMTALLASKPRDTAPAAKTAPAGPQLGANAGLSFDAPDRATAARVIAALKAADAKPSDAVAPVLVDDAAPRRAAKQQAMGKARAEAEAYAGSLGLGRVTLAAISERQDLGSIDYIAQMLKSFGLPVAASSGVVSTDVTLTVTFRLDPR